MYKYIKRLLDIIFSIILIIVLLPLMLVVLIITYFDIKRPLIDIRLPREGINKKPFYMYKIRTRVYDKSGNSSYTKISRFIDKTGLNELPQLFNILKGEMSFVGPRAFICDEELPEGDISPKRYLVKPGIVSLAQSLGGRRLSYKKTLECDEIYYDNFGFVQDVKIFFKSIKTIIKNIFS
ncbi:MAG: sugar transferase [Firmicutes bacterium]|nr:sugar transferase [Bacillota bacterium]